MLTRLVRFAVNPDGSLDGQNGYAGRPAMRGLGRYYELAFTLMGSPDPQTGYIIGIQEIDAAARSSVIPEIARACHETPTTEPAALMPALWAVARSAMPRPLARFSWALTPTYRVEMHMDQPDRVTIRQRFDFAAAHRLHVSDLSDEQNRAIFGKCNNPNGHGHNYQIEPAISIPVEDADAFDLARLEAIIDRAVVEPFDHKHLNHDTPEFDESQGGVIPSVERIAMVSHRRVSDALSREMPHARLEQITVWETDRTSCTFPG